MAKDAVLENLAKEKANLFPTPPIGRIVLWHEHGSVKPEHAIPAIVTAQEGPGRVSLALLSRSRGAVKSGVKYHEMPDAKNPSVRATYNFGCWTYVDGDKPTKETHADYQLHLSSISEREETYKTRVAAEASRPANQKAEV